MLLKPLFHQMLELRLKPQVELAGMEKKDLDDSLFIQIWNARYIAYRNKEMMMKKND